MISAIIQHEIKRLILTRRAWYCLAAIHMLMGIIINWLITNFLKNQIILSTEIYGITEEVIHPFYAWFSLIALIFTPMVTTQALCEEKTQKTILNYYCAPISAFQVIVGKYLAINIILGFILLSISLLPLSMFISCSLDWGQYFSSILGAYLMLSAAFAIGLGISSFMSNALRANVTIFLGLVFFILLEWGAQYAGQNAIFLQSFGLLSPLKNFLVGIINLQNVSYYLLVIYSFLMVGSWRFKRGVFNV